MRVKALFAPPPSFRKLLLSESLTTADAQSSGRVAAFNDKRKRQNRFAILAKSSSTAVLTKGLSVALGALTVSVLLTHLGPERYGVWILITGLVAMVSSSDLGVANALVNLLAEARGREDTNAMRSILASSIATLLVLSVCGMLLLCMLQAFIDWGSVFSITEKTIIKEAKTATVIALALGLALFPLGLLPKTLIANQQGHHANYITTVATALSFCSLFAAANAQKSLPFLVAAFFGTKLLVNAVGCMVVYKKAPLALLPKLSHVSTKHSAKVLKLGGTFLVLQLATLLVYQTDSFIIAHVIGIESISSYSVTWLLFSYLNLLFPLLTPYLWPMFGEAFARKDFRWVKKAFRIYLALCIGLTSLGIGPMIYLSPDIIRVWAGPTAVPTQGLIWSMATWTLCQAALAPFTCLLGGCNRLEYYKYYATATAVANILLSILLATLYGLAGVVLATTISTLIFTLFPSAIESTVLLRRMKEAENATI